MSSITLLVRNWLSIPCLWNISGEILADSEPDGDVNMGVFINDIITWGVGGVGGRPKDEWWHVNMGGEFLFLDSQSQILGMHIFIPFP